MGKKSALGLSECLIVAASANLLRVDRKPFAGDSGGRADKAS